MTDQPRDEVNRYARLGPIGRALVDDHDQIALAAMLVKTQDELARAEAELQQHAENESADAAAGSYALRAEGVEAQLARVASLYEQWVQAGAPPLGVSMARWWDARLVEFQAAIRPPADESARTTVNDAIELGQLRAKVVEFDHIINWHTTCASCARILDSAYAETVRAEKAEAAVTRVRNLASRIRQGVPWTASDDDIAAHILAAVDGDQAPAASCSPAAAETEPNNSRTTVDNPATSSGPHIYLSTGCYHGDHAYCQAMTGLNGAKRPASCKFCHSACQCPCHQQAEAAGLDTTAEDCKPEAATLNSAAANVSRVEPDCCGANPPSEWIGDCWCTLPPGHECEHRCQPCTDRHGAPGWTDGEGVAS